MTTTWKQDFFTQLALKARAESCFIYNPDKAIRPNTPRLEIGEPCLTHTAWNLTDTRIRLTFYTAKSKHEALAEAAVNERRFLALHKFKDKVEREFGEPLIWDYEKGRREQYVDSLAIAKATEYNRSAWPKIQADMIKRTMRLGVVLKPYLRLLDNPMALKIEMTGSTGSRVSTLAQTESTVASIRTSNRKPRPTSRATTIEQPCNDSSDLKI